MSSAKWRPFCLSLKVICVQARQQLGMGESYHTYITGTDHCIYVRSRWLTVQLITRRPSSTSEFKLISPSAAHMRQWIRSALGQTVACSTPSHYLNQCWVIINWTLRKKLQWNFNQNANPFIHENAYENIVCEKAAILSKGDELRAVAPRTRRSYCPACRTYLIATRFWVVVICPIIKCLTVLEFSFILFDLCLFITIFNFIFNYVPIVTFWIFTYHKIWILLINFCFIWNYWIIYFLTCLEVFWSVVS